MPRKQPLSNADRAIAARLRELREIACLSRQDLAKRARISVDTIIGIEFERAPLKYEHARVLLVETSDWHFYPFNPLWLSDGVDPIQLGWPLLLPRASEIGLNPKCSFSEFVARHRPLLESLVKSFADESVDCRLPESWLNPYFTHWVLLDRKHSRMAKGIAFIECLFCFSAEDLVGASADARRVLREYWKATDSPVGEKMLTETSQKGKTSAVQSEIQSLIGRVKDAASKPGVKAQLARHLDVAPARISEWLSGVKEPGGNYTLQLLKWVEQRSVIKKVGSGSVSARPERKTQVGNSSYEKTSSSRKKK